MSEARSAGSKESKAAGSEGRFVRPKPLAPGRRGRFLRAESPASELVTATPQEMLVERARTTTLQSVPETSVKLSILMPAYNEERTLQAAIDAVVATAYPCDWELIVVDDGSQDATARILDTIDHPRVRVHHHVKNCGKGAALTSAALLASGTHIVPFDADMEYAPSDLVRLLEPVIHGRCDVVYGTRLFGANTSYQSYRHAVGNRALTTAANLLYDAYLSDLHTCLKLMPLELFRQMALREKRFGLDTEVTARILRMGIRPFEVPVSYHSRSFENGKKITWRDGVQCLHVLARVRFSRAGTPATALVPTTVGLLDLEGDTSITTVAS